MTGDFVKALVTGANEYDLIGEPYERENGEENEPTE